MTIQRTWPALRNYTGEHLDRIALPLGGIGTGTVSLGGRGDLRDWEIVNRPAKGFVPGPRFGRGPFFSLWAREAGGAAVTRLLEGPLGAVGYEGASGSETSNHGMPRFADCAFEAAYPLGQVSLSDKEVPVEVRLEAFNPLIPTDAERSSLPLAVLRYRLKNRSKKTVQAAVCATIPNFIGTDGAGGECKKNRNRFKKAKRFQGLFFDSRGVDAHAAQWGSMALVSTAGSGVSQRTAWLKAGWGTSTLDFWDDFSADGALEERKAQGEDMPLGSLAVKLSLKPGVERSITFVLAWHFPNRRTWTPGEDCCGEEDPTDTIGNYYAERFKNAWDVVAKTVPQLKKLEQDTLRFVEAFCGSDLPADAKEAALFNLSTLRTQTCFRTPDGNLYGFEGYNDHEGCCLGSCTHVWNYEQSTAFLFGDLAKSMRQVEFAHATDEQGMMSFRVYLPLTRSQQFGKAAADGQMGCIVKLYRDWQLCGDEAFLRQLWPHAKRALEFCWIKGGWDADRDGVMEGCQHNTMDVEYFGPNPQMGLWYLCALRAAEEMATHLGETDFAAECRRLFKSGSQWVDEHLFNGEYYEHKVMPPKNRKAIAPSLLLGAGASDVTKPDYQLAQGCLVDQLVGQLLAHVCGLGYLVKKGNVSKTLRSIFKYNRRTSLEGHFNCLRSYALGDEAALLMAAYPKGRPKNPFPYFTEVMTGFEYTAAVGMLYEGQERNGLRCIGDIRARYDGRKRSPFDEAECGHHYARAMLAWGAVLAWSGFRYSAVSGTMVFGKRTGRFFWSTGYAWGTCNIKGTTADLRVLGGEVEIRRLEIGARTVDLPRSRRLKTGARLRLG